MSVRASRSVRARGGRKIRGARCLHSLSSHYSAGPGTFCDLPHFLFSCPLRNLRISTTFPRISLRCPLECHTLYFLLGIERPEGTHHLEAKNHMRSDKRGEGRGVAFPAAFFCMACVAAALFQAFPARGEEAVRTLTLEECLALSEANHPDLAPVAAADPRHLRDHDQSGRPAPCPGPGHPPLRPERRSRRP